LSNRVITGFIIFLLRYSFFYGYSLDFELSQIQEFPEFLNFWWSLGFTLYPSAILYLNQDSLLPGFPIAWILYCLPGFPIPWIPFCLDSLKICGLGISGFLIYICDQDIPRLPYIFGLSSPGIPYICGLGIPWIPSPLHPEYSIDSLNYQRSRLSSGILLSMAWVYWVS
jgi:hypothetical protein